MQKTWIIILNLKNTTQVVITGVNGLETSGCGGHSGFCGTSSLWRRVRGSGFGGRLKFDTWTSNYMKVCVQDEPYRIKKSFHIFLATHM